MLFEIPPEKLDYPFLAPHHQALALEKIRVTPASHEHRESISADGLEFLVSLYCEPKKLLVISGAMDGSLEENWRLVYRRGDGTAFLNTIKSYAQPTQFNNVPYLPGGRPAVEHSVHLHGVDYHSANLHHIPRGKVREFVVWGGERGIFLLMHLVIDPQHRAPVS